MFLPERSKRLKCNKMRAIKLCRLLIVYVRTDRLGLGQRECTFREVNAHVNRIDEGGFFEK